MKILADHLIHLETMKWDNFDVAGTFHWMETASPHLRVLGQRSKNIIAIDCSYQQLYVYFKPDRRVETLIFHIETEDQVLPEILAERHPNIKKLGEISASVDNFNTLNRLLVIERVQLQFMAIRKRKNHSAILKAFEIFLMCHLHLKHLGLSSKMDGFGQLVYCVVKHRPKLVFLELEQLKSDTKIQENFFPYLYQMKHLQEFRFYGPQNQNYIRADHVLQMLNHCLKIERFTFVSHSNNPPEAEELAVKFMEENPGRRVLFKFTQDQNFST